MIILDNRYSRFFLMIANKSFHKTKAGLAFHSRTFEGNYQIQRSWEPKGTPPQK